MRLAKQVNDLSQNQNDIVQLSRNQFDRTATIIGYIRMTQGMNEMFNEQRMQIQSIIDKLEAASNPNGRSMKLTNLEKAVKMIVMNIIIFKILIIQLIIRYSKHHNKYKNRYQENEYNHPEIFNLPILKIQQQDQYA